MLTGACAPNGPITAQDITTFRMAGFRAAKLLASDHMPSDVALLKLQGVEKFLVRLFDTYNSVRDFKEGQYVADCVGVIERFYPEGVRDYEVDNEPNITWLARGLNEWQYRYYMLRVIPEIRRQVVAKGMRDVRLGFAPLSLAIEYNPKAWLWVCKDVVEICDFVCINNYWQFPKYAYWREFGGACVWYHELFPKKELQITEWGNSLVHSNPPPTQAQIEAAQVEQYPAWLKWISQFGYVSATYVFQVGGTQEWAGFKLTDKAARAIGCGATS